MSFLQRFFGRADPRRVYDPLYRAIVAAARDPAWYRDGKVPDTVDGRFDMVAAILALVLLRLEAEGDVGRDPSVLVTELFIEDMDSSLRQIGIGDYVVGKHVGRLMGALGGRLTALRAARAGEDSFAGAVRRNIFRDTPPGDDAVDWVAKRLERMSGAIDAQAVPPLLSGKLPAP